MRINRNLIYTIVQMATFTQVCGQDFHITYTTELQTNIHGRFNWVNLLRPEATIPLGNIAEINIATIHICKTREERLADDMQTFSNIEEDNMAGNIAMLGMTLGNRTISLFAGVRNMNEDYFTSRVTSLFTNSSCGIFPTISSDVTIPNYPLAAFCIDCKVNLDKWNMEASVYNGQAYHGFKDGGVFRIAPATEGILGIASINHSSDYGNYYMGGSVHNRVYNPCNEREQTKKETVQKRKETEIAWWIYGEKQITVHDKRTISIMAQYSENIKAQSGCRRYAGIGMTMDGIIPLKKENRLGFFSDYAQYDTCSETATELTWLIRLTGNISLQPALHCIHTGNHTYGIAILRMSYETDI